MEEQPSETLLIQELESGRAKPLVFVLNANLLAMVKLVNCMYIFTFFSKHFHRTHTQLILSQDVYIDPKRLHFHCVTDVNRRCWCMTTKGMHAVGQVEVVVLLQCLPEEKSFPRDIFSHFIQLFRDTVTGQSHTRSHAHSCHDCFPALSRTVAYSPSFLQGRL